MSVSLANGVSILYTKELIAGSGIAFTETSTSITIDATGGGGGGQAGIQFQDEGSNLGSLGTVTTINFTGSGVTATRVSNTVTVDVTGGGSGTDLGYTASTRLLTSSTGADVTLPLFTSTEAGLTPLSGGGTANFLRADGTWAAPAGGGGGGLTYGRAYALARGYALP